MKKFIKTGIALTAATMLLAGCGEPLLMMNESEEAIVVSYSAGALSKRNRYQPEGLTVVYQGEEEEGQEEEPVNTPARQEEPADSVEPEEPIDIIEPEDFVDIVEPEEFAAASDLAAALGLSGLQISYTDYFTSDSYQQGDYFSLDAEPGNVFVILNFNVANTTAEEIQCDLLTQRPIFTLGIDGGTGIRNEVTVLSNDLSTYHNPIGAGQTEVAILLFEVPEATAESISSVQLSVQLNGTANRLALE